MSYYDKDYLKKLRETFGYLTQDLTIKDWRDLRNDKRYFESDKMSHDEIYVLKHKIEWIKKWKSLNNK
jgi:hypothetical protein